MAVRILLLAAALALSGCQRYEITLNERVISRPPPVPTLAELADEALATCVRQHLHDRRLGDPRRLRALVCSHAGIADLRGIELLSGLQTLGLAHNALTSLTPLFRLPALRRVDLRGNDELTCAEVDALAARLPEGGELLPPEACARR
ncbi:MAG: hypothetical protein KatS3mg124_0438 [Porticoccaceae bacterium]|nr:MAG: hypothetical protein KatS3mg124_0438 [Porticoccaceae bacterium]